VGIGLAARNGDVAPVIQNSTKGNNSDTSEFIVFSKIWKNSVKTRKIRLKQS
jgi:hypothetical protein